MDLEREIYYALLRSGYIIPTTEEEVRIAEEAMEGLEIALPESLKEPPLHLLRD